MSERLTPKQKVLKKYPKAFVETCGMEIMQVVSPLPYGRVRILGTCGRATRTDLAAKRAAWANAARNLKARPDGR